MPFPNSWSLCAVKIKKDSCLPAKSASRKIWSFSEQRSDGCNSWRDKGAERYIRWFWFSNNFNDNATDAIIFSSAIIDGVVRKGEDVLCSNKGLILLQLRSRRESAMFVWSSAWCFRTDEDSKTWKKEYQSVGFRNFQLIICKICIIEDVRETWQWS